MYTSRSLARIGNETLREIASALTGFALDYAWGQGRPGTFGFLALCFSPTVFHVIALIE